MKILQIHNFYNIPGGECSVVRAERRLLEENGHEVMQFTADSAELAGYSLSRKARSFLQLPYNLETTSRLAQFLKTHRPDVSHVHNVFPLLSPSVYVALKRHGIPVVQTIHNYRFLCPNGLFFTHGRVCQDCLHDGLIAAVRNKCMHDSRLVSAMYAAAVGIAWRTGNLPDNIDRYISLNRFGANMLAAGGVPEHKIRICGNFVERIAGAPAPKKRYILYLGRLSPEKGLWTLFKALRKTAGVALKIAGTGPLTDELNNYVKKNPDMNVEFVGFVHGSEKERLIGEALCTVVPSEWYENFPVSVLESLAHGTPVIASRMGGLPEMVDHDQTGLLFTAGNDDELAVCLTKIWDDEGKVNRMAITALSAARSRFGSDMHYQQLTDIYQDARASPKMHGEQ